MRRGPSPISKRIRIINNKFRELWDKNLLKYNLTGMQMEILCYLKCNPDKEIHQREIEYWFQLKNPTVTGILNRLEEKGYITRRRNPDYRSDGKRQSGHGGYGRGSQKSGRTNLRLYDGRGTGKASGASGSDPGDYDGK